jgi:hypothetical protein
MGFCEQAIQAAAAVVGTPRQEPSHGGIAGRDAHAAAAADNSFFNIPLATHTPGRVTAVATTPITAEVARIASTSASPHGRAANTTAEAAGAAGTERLKVRNAKSISG